MPVMGCGKHWRADARLPLGLDAATQTKCSGTAQVQRTQLYPSGSLSSFAMRALWLLLAFPLAFAACGDYGSNNPDGGSGAGVSPDVVTRPATTPRPGDTLTFFVVFPDSVSDRYNIRWDLDERGKGLRGGCSGAVCAKWIVPVGANVEYTHDVTVSSRLGLSRHPFKTILP